MNLSNKQKIEVSAYIVTIALAVPSFAIGYFAHGTSIGDLFINLSATFAGV